MCMFVVRIFVWLALFHRDVCVSYIISMYVYFVDIISMRHVCLVYVFVWLALSCMLPLQILQWCMYLCMCVLRVYVRVYFVALIVAVCLLVSRHPFLSDSLFLSLSLAYSCALSSSLAFSFSYSVSFSLSHSPVRYTMLKRTAKSSPNPRITLPVLCLLRVAHKCDAYMNACSHTHMHMHSGIRNIVSCTQTSWFSRKIKSCIVSYLPRDILSESCLEHFLHAVINPF